MMLTTNQTTARNFGLALAALTMITLMAAPAAAEIEEGSHAGVWMDDEATEEAKYTHYSDLARSLGHNVDERPVLMGLRGLSLFADTPHQVRSTSLKYDDAFVFLVPETGEVHTFEGATHPFMRRSDRAPDVDEDGIGDVALIRPGFYHVDRMDPERLLVRSPDGSMRIPAYRDFNHDGIFDTQEKMLSMLAKSGPQVAPGIGAFASAILFHVGGGFGSIGCQTAAVVNIELLHNNAPFDYLLVDALDINIEPLVADNAALNSPELFTTDNVAHVTRAR